MPFFIPFLVLAGVAIGSAFFADGCGGAKKAPPPKPNPCDAFKRTEEHHYLDQDSYRALNFLWPARLSAAKIENWDARARVYIGAADSLFKPLCEKRSTPEAEADMAKYAEASRTFFEGHYASKALTADDGVLVLIAGLAPTAIDEITMKGAMDAFVRDDASQAQFAKLLAAGQKFNRAAEVARVDRKIRYNTPKAPCNLTPAERKAAKELVTRAEEEAAAVDLTKLSDKQRELAADLRTAAETLRKSLGAGCVRAQGSTQTVLLIDESRAGKKIWKIQAPGKIHIEVITDERPYQKK